MPSKLSQNSQPYLYEINTWPWLEAIGTTDGRAIDLGAVPDRYWDEIADLGFDGLWLIGVWQRSPAGIGLALTNDDLRVSFDAAPPDWQPYDVVGSPYCVHGYVLDEHFGGRSALASCAATATDTPQQLSAPVLQQLPGGPSDILLIKVPSA